MKKGIYLSAILITLLLGFTWYTNRTESKTNSHIAEKITSSVSIQEISISSIQQAQKHAWKTRLCEIRDRLSEEAAKARDFTAPEVIEILKNTLSADRNGEITSADLYYETQYGIAGVELSSKIEVSTGVIRKITIHHSNSMSKCMIEYISSDNAEDSLFSELFSLGRHQAGNWNVYGTDEADYIFIGSMSHGYMALGLADGKFTSAKTTLSGLFSTNDTVSIIQTESGSIIAQVTKNGEVENLPFNPQTLSFGYPIVIPNPESSDRPVHIFLKDDWNEDAAYMTELSWLGFQDPVKISGFSVGSTSDIEEAVICNYEKVDTNRGDKYDTNEIMSGGFLVLVVSVSDDTKQQENYIILLDYVNQKSYKIPTTIPYAWQHPTDIVLADITGDGKPEIAVMDTPNAHHTGVVFEIVRFTGSELKSIYQRDLSWNSVPDNYFKATLIDHYKAKISCPSIGFSCEISLSDAGLEKTDLEIEIESQDTIEKFVDEEANRCYENGKVVKDGLRMGLLDEIILFDEEKEVELTYNVYLGRWYEVAKVRARLKYDPAEDTLVVKKVDCSVSQDN